MKKSNRYYSAVRIAISVFVCGTVFFAGAYLYLESSIKKIQQSADAKNNSIPYSSKRPEEKVLLFVMPDNTGCVLHLNFENETIGVIFSGETDENTTDYYGYKADYTFKIDFDTLEEIIDRAGGVNLETDGEVLRFTGVQVTELISVTVESESILREVVKGILHGFDINGFEKDDMVYIIENSETSLTVADCLYWYDYIPVMLSHINIVN